MMEIFKGLNNIMNDINHRLSNSTFDSIVISKPKNSLFESKLINQSSYNSNKLKEKKAIESDFNSIGKDLFKSLHTYEQSRGK